MTGDSQSRFGLGQPSHLFVLAIFGMHIAFMPLLVLLLPRRVELLFGVNATTVLSSMLLVGAITASIANIVAGHIGDRWLKIHHNRRGLIAIGLVLLTSSFLPLALATEPTSLAIAVIAFQVALNLALSPTMAVLTDHIPTAQKGTIAGMVGAALPLSALGTTVLGWAFPDDSNIAFFATGLFVLVCAAPFVIFWGFETVGQADTLRDNSQKLPTSANFRSLALLWFARLLVQFAASFVLLYLFLHIVGLIAHNATWQDESAAHFISIVSLLGAVAAVPAAIFAGRLSDHLNARQTIMIGAALLLSLALALLGSNPAPQMLGIAFILFQVGVTVYISVDAALVAQLISHHPRRGKILGVMNLTNTLPAILAPLMTLQLASATGGEIPYRLIYILSSASLVAAIFAVHRSRGMP